MRVEATLNNAGDVLNEIFPVSGLIHVGSCTEQLLRRFRAWGISQALFIEANAEFASSLEAAIQDQPGWRVYPELVGDSAIERSFFHASNPHESGLLAPEKLSHLWKNIKTQEESRRPAVTLQAVIEACQSTVATPNWLVVDCLPASVVLAGLGEMIARFDVISARALLDDSLPGQGANQKELEEFLAARGFRRIAVEPERHPALGALVYVRDFRSTIDELTTTRDEQAKLAADRQVQLTAAAHGKDEQAKLVAERQTQIEALTKARDEQAKLAAERQAQIEALTEARDEQAKLAADRQAQLMAATQGKDEHAKLAAERQAQIEALTQARDEQAKLAADRQAQLTAAAQGKDEQAKLAAERQAQIEALTKARDEQAKLAADRQAQLTAATQGKDEQAKRATERQTQIEALTKARDEQARLAQTRESELANQNRALQESKARIAQLESLAAEANIRQQMLNEEMIKAEGQIELIKDLLLRESGL